MSEQNVLEGTVTDLGGDTLPAGGPSSSWGGLIAGINNIGLQWYAAATRGVNKITVPSPTQTTPGGVYASQASTVANYGGIFIIILAVAVAIFAFRRAGR